MKRPNRRCLVVSGLVLTGFLIIVFVLLPAFIEQMIAGKYDAADAGQFPSATAQTPVAEVQTEPHTCGLHAMRSLYVAYGMTPEVFRLRFRLGTDEPAMRADSESTGTLHPDLYRVLAQDGFKATPLDLGAGDAHELLDAHLTSGQLALAVVYRSTYHWILLDGGDAVGELVVTDSLSDEPITTTTAELVDEALSITLVGPVDGAEPASASDAHAAGLAEMARLYGRE